MLRHMDLRLRQRQRRPPAVDEPGFSAERWSRRAPTGPGRRRSAPDGLVDLARRRTTPARRHTPVGVWRVGSLVADSKLVLDDPARECEIPRSEDPGRATAVIGATKSTSNDGDGQGNPNRSPLLVTTVGYPHGDSAGDEGEPDQVDSAMTGAETTPLNPLKYAPDPKVKMPPSEPAKS